MKEFCVLVCGIVILLWLVYYIYVFCTNFKKVVDKQRKVCYYDNRKEKEIERRNNENMACLGRCE